jgi:hypothetical protein
LRLGGTGIVIFLFALSCPPVLGATATLACGGALANAIEVDWRPHDDQPLDPAGQVRSRLLIRINDPLHQVQGETFSHFLAAPESLDVLQFIHRQLEHDGDGHQRRQLIVDIERPSIEKPHCTSVHSEDLPDGDPETLKPDHAQIVINLNAPLTLDSNLEMVGSTRHAAIQELRRMPKMAKVWDSTMRKLREQVLELGLRDENGDLFSTWPEEKMFRQLGEGIVNRMVWVEQMNVWQLIRKKPDAEKKDVKMHSKFEAILTSNVHLAPFERDQARDDLLKTELLNFYQQPPYNLDASLNSYAVRNGHLEGFDSQLLWHKYLPHALVPIIIVVR